MGFYQFKKKVQTLPATRAITGSGNTKGKGEEMTTVFEQLLAQQPLPRDILKAKGVKACCNCGVEICREPITLHNRPYCQDCAVKVERQ